MQLVSKLGIVVVCLCVSTAAADQFYATTVWGTLYDLDSASGQATNPRNTNTTHLVDIEWGLDGVLYGLTSFGGTPPNTLFRINPATGAATAIGPTGLSRIYEGDLACDPTTGDLYGAYDAPGFDEMLFRLDRATGQATYVGAIPFFGDYSGLSFDRNGNLWGLDTDGNLVGIDKHNANVLSLTPLSGFRGSITAGMACDPVTGTMYVASGDVPTSILYSLDTSNGLLTEVANTNVSGWGGLVVVPEPAGLLLLALLGALRRPRG